MSITVTFNSYEEMVAFAKQIAGVPEQGEVKQKVKKAKEPIPSESEIGWNNAPAGIEDEVPFEKEETKTYTLEEVRAELAKLTRSGKQKEVKEILTSFGAKNLSSVDPKDYTALMEKAGAI